MSLRSFIDSILVRSPAQAILASRTSERLVVLAYHGIEDSESFREHIEYLSTELYPVSLPEVLEAIDGRGLPERATLVTFDDADRSIKEQALPILQKYSVPAVAFVVAGHLDSDRPFWWQEVDALMRRGASVPEYEDDAAQTLRALKEMDNRDRVKFVRSLQGALPHIHIRAENLKKSDLPMLQKAGIDIGNHSMTHPMLDRCSAAEIRDEIQISHQILEGTLGESPRAFAYPNGNYDPRSDDILRELGYEAGFLFDHRTGQLRAENRFRISRVRVNSTTPLDRFRLIASGLHPMLHHALGRA